MGTETDTRPETENVEDVRAEHVLEFPGGYTRSTGPVIGRFLTGLRDGRILGVASPAHAGALVPPTEYDPETAAPLGAEDADWSEVGPAGTVTTWTWVDEPRPEHPLDRPFAWALVKPDGAATALLHAVDAGSKAAMASGMRVTPRWRAERTGSVADIECFVPGEEAVPAPALPPLADGAEREPITSVTIPSRLRYRLRGGQVWNRFIDGMAVGRIRGTRCAACQKVYVPPRGACPACGQPTTEWVDLPDTGVLTTFAVNNIPAAGAPPVPFICGYVLLDGADIAMLVLVSGIAWNEVRMGMRVKAEWVPEAERTRSVRNLKWFTPTGEPDVPFETYEEYV